MTERSSRVPAASSCSRSWSFSRTVPQRVQGGGTPCRQRGPPQGTFGTTSAVLSRLDGGWWSLAETSPKMIPSSSTSPTVRCQPLLSISSTWTAARGSTSGHLALRRRGARCTRAARTWTRPPTPSASSSWAGALLTRAPSAARTRWRRCKGTRWTSAALSGCPSLRRHHPGPQRGSASQRSAWASGWSSTVATAGATSSASVRSCTS
mmetsp:Transcript_107658/g.347475  ORF Transcript_107658/g.347475 Transcript_107658/m.347475 type:complete len:208 (-) Transcript_107658:815-1438(-)